MNSLISNYWNILRENPDEFSPSMFNVYFYLWFCCNKHSLQTSTTNDEIAEHCGISERQVRRSVDKLVNLNLIERIYKGCMGKASQYKLITVGRAR